MPQVLAGAGVWLWGAAGPCCRLPRSSPQHSPSRSVVGAAPGPPAGGGAWAAARCAAVPALAWEFLPQTNHHLCYPYRRGHRPSIILPS